MQTQDSKTYEHLKRMYFRVLMVKESARMVQSP